MADLSVEKERLEGLVGELLREARLNGATAAEAAVSYEAGFSVNVRMGEIETVEHHRDKGLGVTVYMGQAKGSASTSDFSAAAIKETVKAACTIARYTAADDYAGLADAEFMAKETPDLDLYHPWDVSVEHAIDLALETEGAAREADARIVNSEGASVSSHQGFRVYGNTHGFVGGYPSTSHSLSCSVLGEEQGSMQRDYWYSSARDAQDLETAAAVGRQAAERAVRRLNGRRLPTCQIPVLFAAEVASSLLSHFIGAIRGGSLYRRSSFLLDSLEKQIFPPFVTIYERPHLRKGLGSAPYDSEGVATRSQDIVKEGILKTYLLDSYSARKLGMQTTGNAGGVHNLFIDSGAKDFPALVKEMNKGLIVTELMGQGVNRVTGDYSRGAAGFWVEDGQIQYPVEEITVAGNLRDMFMRIVEVGNDVDRRKSVQTGTILIEEMTIAGT